MVYAFTNPMQHIKYKMPIILLYNARKYYFRFKQSKIKFKLFKYFSEELETNTKSIKTVVVITSGTILKRIE